MTQTLVCRWRGWRWLQPTGTGCWLCHVSRTPPTPGNPCLIGIVFLARFIWFIATGNWQTHICIFTHWSIYCSGNNISVFIGPKSDHCLASKSLLLYCRKLADVTLACEDHATPPRVKQPLFTQPFLTDPWQTKQLLKFPPNFQSFIKIFKLNFLKLNLRKWARQLASLDSIAGSLFENNWLSWQIQTKPNLQDREG